MVVGARPGTVGSLLSRWNQVQRVQRTIGHTFFENITVPRVFRTQALNKAFSNVPAQFD